VGFELSPELVECRISELADFPGVHTQGGANSNERVIVLVEEGEDSLVQWFEGANSSCEKKVDLMGCEPFFRSRVGGRCEVLESDVRVGVWGVRMKRLVE
jgi:hypothetical protein